MCGNSVCPQAAAVAAANFGLAAPGYGEAAQ
jgi:hypothetical protein